MKTLRFLIIATALSLPCFAWNCTGNDIRVQVPTGTVGAGTGDGPGQVVVDNGLTFQCQPPATVVPPVTPTPTNTSSSTSGATSGSTSTSGATATGGNSTSGASATGGNAAGGAGGNSSSNATGGQGGQGGSSTSTNTNTVTGGSANGNGSNNKTSQGQTQSNSSTNANQSSASNQSNGNGSNSNDTTNNVEAPKIPVNTAVAPTGLPTVTCFKPTTMGAQSAAFGIAFGGGKIDDNCARLEVARSFDVAGERLAACKVKISNKYSKQAGVSLDDCMQQQKQAVVIPATVAPTPAPQIIVVPMTAPVALSTSAAVEAFQGFYTRTDNVMKARLDGTILLLQKHPDSHLRLRYNPAWEAGMLDIKAYLLANGIDAERVEVRDDGYEKGVEVIFIQ